ncbi:MAG: DUF5946 family protein [Bacteroidota bacterium]
MQDYIQFASKNGITLKDYGHCPFCGAETQRGIHECMEIFAFDFPHIDFSDPENHRYKFLIVDAHALQHPEIHGQWSNHFHLTRLHLMFVYKVGWTYALSPKLSDSLNRLKKHLPQALSAPPMGQRGHITTRTIIQSAREPQNCKHRIEVWGQEVYRVWKAHHGLAETIAQAFLNRKKGKNEE